MRGSTNEKQLSSFAEEYVENVYSNVADVENQTSKEFGDVNIT